MTRPALAAGLLLAAMLTGCGAESDASGEPRRSPSSTPSSTFRSVPDGATQGGAHVPLESGTYLIPSSAWSVADFKVTFPEGWTVQHGQVFAKHSDEEDEFGFYPVVVDEIYTDPCRGDGVLMEVGPGVDDLDAALIEQLGPVVTATGKTRLGGYPATRIDLRVPKSLNLEACRFNVDGVRGLQIWYSAPADKYFVLLSNASASVYILEVDGERQVFLTQLGNPRSAADRAELRTVLDSIRIEG